MKDRFGTEIKIGDIVLHRTVETISTVIGEAPEGKYNSPSVLVAGRVGQAAQWYLHNTEVLSPERAMLWKLEQ